MSNESPFTSSYFAAPLASFTLNSVLRAPYSAAIASVSSVRKVELIHCARPEEIESAINSFSAMSRKTVAWSAVAGVCANVK